MNEETQLQEQFDDPNQVDMFEPKPLADQLDQEFLNELRAKMQAIIVSAKASGYQIIVTSTGTIEAIPENVQCLDESDLCDDNRRQFVRDETVHSDFKVLAEELLPLSTEHDVLLEA